MRRSTAFLLLLFSASVVAQKPTLKPDDYKQWESLVAPRISANGKWITYQINLVDGDGRLVIKDSDGPIAAQIPVGSSAQFSEDSNWVAYMISPPKAIADKLREEKKPVQNKLGLRNLLQNRERIFDDVQRYFLTKNGKTLVAHLYRGAEKKQGGSDLVIFDLATEELLTIGNVTQAIPNRDGSLIALHIESDSQQEGVQLLNPATGQLRTLQWGSQNVYGLDWAEKADVLSFLVGTPQEGKEGDANTVVIASNLTASPSYKRFVVSQRAGFPTGHRIAEWRGTALNDDGTAVAFGIAPWADRKRPDGKPEDKPTVEVWNYRDIRVVPQQKVTANQDRQRTELAVWRISDDKFVQVTTNSEFESPMLMGNFDHVVVQDTRPYATPVTNGFGFRDAILVDTRTGARKPLVSKLRWSLVPSDTGKYVAYFKEKNWWLYDVSTGQSRNVTQGLPTTFVNEENDLTIPEKPPVGGAQWLHEDQALILNDHYDVWQVNPTGNVRKLTSGRAEKVIFRLDDLGDSEDGPTIDRPLYFTLRDEKTKASGFYRLMPSGEAKVLTMADANLTNLSKSKGTDRVIFQMSTFEKSPDLYLTNTDFTAIKPESSLNPQQANYAWGRAELIDFKSRWGKELQGILIYPADYQPGRQYPMVTYIYERLSDNLHNYVNPSEWSSYNAQALSQNGYFVFMPDIAYKGRTPGQNAVDCLEPAVAAVLAKKVGVDANRIGLMGHSWGGYQTAFVTSVSNLFKVGVAGAPLTDLTSMYNAFYWNSGTSNQVLLETGQGRLEVPFWEDPETYFANSPVWQSSKRTAPILIAHGDQDGAVDWHQGLALYQTLRRMGKPCVLLVYRGENHGLAQRANQLDYTRRLRHYFDVHLKGASPERWVTDGERLIDRN